MVSFARPSAHSVSDLRGPQGGGRGYRKVPKHWPQKLDYFGGPSDHILPPAIIIKSCDQVMAMLRVGQAVGRGPIKLDVIHLNSTIAKVRFQTKLSIANVPWNLSGHQHTIYRCS